MTPAESATEINQEALEKALENCPLNDRYPRIEAIRTYLAALPATEAGQWKPTCRHKKRGTEYEIVGAAAIQTDKVLSDYDEVVVYRGHDGKLWARPTSEMNDGRFEALPAVERATTEALINSK